MPFISPYQSRRPKPSQPRRLYEPQRDDGQRQPTHDRRRRAHIPTPQWDNAPIFQKRRRIALIVLCTLVIIIALIIGLTVHKSSSPSTVPLEKPQETEQHVRHDSSETLSAAQLDAIPRTPRLIVAVPGTWETSSTANPSKPVGMLTFVSSKKDSSTGVFFLPYPAQFRSTGHGDDMTYNDSRAIGVTRLIQTIDHYLSQQPEGNVIVVGFSQGAVIAGDTLTAIGNNMTTIDPYHVAAGLLLADGRREVGFGENVGGKKMAPQGLEVSLASLGKKSEVFFRGTGATMTGSRGQNFGVLRSRVYQLCHPQDPICASPSFHDASPQELMRQFTHVASTYSTHHSGYAKEKDPIWGNMTALRWMSMKMNKILAVLPS